MKIALMGYGRMGREVEAVAIDAGHEIVGRFDIDNVPTSGALAATGADVAIEFSTPASVLANMKAAADAGVDIVVGATGWYDHLEEVRGWFDRSALIYAQNFSIGVNVFYRIVRQAARTMNGLPGYDVWVEEQHHREKVDSPSGTAFRLGEIILEELDRKRSTITGSPEGKIPPDALQIASVRSGHIAGVHTVGFDSEADYIELKHVARSRRGFAEGAVAAARWVRGRQGVYTMDDVQFE